jgi:hypothetical protein
MVQNPFNAKTQRREDAKKIKKLKDVLFSNLKESYSGLILSLRRCALAS